MMLVHHQAHTLQYMVATFATEQVHLHCTNFAVPKLLYLCLFLYARAYMYTVCIYIHYICLCLSAADECLPEEKRALLKWKMSPITPNVVRSCLTRVGFAKLKSEQKES